MSWAVFYFSLSQGYDVPWPCSLHPFAPKNERTFNYISRSNGLRTPWCDLLGQCCLATRRKFSTFVNWLFQSLEFQNCENVYILCSLWSLHFKNNLSFQFSCLDQIKEHLYVNNSRISVYDIRPKIWSLYILERIHIHNRGARFVRGNSNFHFEITNIKNLLVQKPISQLGICLHQHFFYFYFAMYNNQTYIDKNTSVEYPYFVA